MRVLIVEDDPRMGRLLQQGMSAEGISVHLEAEGEDPDQIQLPELDGQAPELGWIGLDDLDSLEDLNDEPAGSPRESVSIGRAHSTLGRNSAAHSRVLPFRPTTTTYSARGSFRPSNCYPMRRNVPGREEPI